MAYVATETRVFQIMSCFTKQKKQGTVLFTTNIVLSDVSRVFNIWVCRSLVVILTYVSPEVTCYSTATRYVCIKLRHNIDQTFDRNTSLP